MQALREFDEGSVGGAGGGGAQGAAAAAESERAAVRAERARNELRRGRAIAVLDGEGAGALLALSIETLVAARWATLQAFGHDWRLLLTRERLHAIGRDHGASADSLRLEGPFTVERLRGLAGVSNAAAGHSDGERLGEPRAADASMQAALMLARRARLAPALVVCELAARSAPLLDDAQILRLAAHDVMPGEQPGTPTLLRLSDARVPLAGHEDCELVVFGEAHGDAEHVAVVVGRPDTGKPVAVRLHSSCLTGDLLGSLRCDCGDQLRGAVAQLAEAGGVLIYLAHEGRGIGLVNKLRAYRLQDGGLDTFDANHYLGFAADQRDFRPAAAMLRALGIGRVRLLTNNPRKIEALGRCGIEVVERLPLAAPGNAHNARYIAAKQAAGHLA